MAGNSNSGRRPKPTHLLRQSATYRHDRHDGRADASYGGSPSPPNNLGVEAKKLWNLVLENSPANVLAAIDGPQLMAMARWFQLWFHYDAQVLDFPENPKLARGAMLSAQNAWREFASLASQFGMSPVARCKIKASGGIDENDPILSLFGHLTDSDSA